MAAGYIRGITISFGADTTKLNGALKKTQGTINKTQAELKQINRALKFNPGNATLLQQKFKLLSASVEQTEGKLKQLREMQAKMNASGVDKASAQYRELEREIIKTENQLKQAEGDLKRFGSVGKQQALAVGNAFKSAGTRIQSVGRSITTTMSVYGVAGIYAGAKLIDMSQKQAQAEQKLIEIYKTRMGVDKKAAQSTMQLATAQQKLGVIGDEVQLAGAQQLATYAKYPSTVNTLLPAMNNLLVQQKGMNATQEDAASMANLFGKAMMGQTGALKRAGISFTEAQAEIMKTGTEEEKAAVIAEVVTQNVGNMNAEFAKTDAGKIQQAKNALGDMGEEIGAILLPAVADLVSWFQNNLLPKLQTLINFLQQHPAIAKFALAFAAITAVLGPLIMIIGSLVTAIGSITAAAAAADIALAPIVGTIGLIVAAVAAAIAIGVLLYKNWDTIKKKATAIWTAIKTAMFKLIQKIVLDTVAKFGLIRTKITTIWTNIKTRVSTAVTNIKTKVSSVFNSLKTTVSNVWNKIKTAITRPIQAAKDKVKGIIDKIKGYFPLKLKKLVSFSLPKISIGSKSTKVGDKSVKSPTFGVGGWKRYAKAVNQPYMFTRASRFIAGETSDEMLYGHASLMNDIMTAMKRVNGGEGITVNVYGSDNMSVSELANAVEQRLITMQKRRTQAWA